MFKSKVLLVTGGADFFGNEVPKHFLRDEKKQGDMRDVNSIIDAMRGADYVFHAAELKQVSSCKFYPIQAVQTHVIVTENVLHCAINAGVDKGAILRTNKAVYQINAMGVAKAMVRTHHSVLRS